MKADSWTGWIELDWKPGRGLRNDPGSFCPLKDVVTEAQRRGESFQGHTAFGMQSQKFTASRASTQGVTLGEPSLPLKPLAPPQWAGR